MKADVYRTGKGNTYLFLPQGEPFSKLSQSVLDGLGSLQFFKTVDLGPKMIGANPEMVKADFEKQGYSIVQSKVAFGTTE